MTSSVTAKASVRASSTLPTSESATQCAETSTAERFIPYTLVHMVAGETLKDLIIPQVVMHMAQQAETAGPLRPARVLIAFLEPVRVALRRHVRTRVREIRRSAPSVQVMLLPYVSRFSVSANARILGRLLRLKVGADPVVFHCRGESAAKWAIELKPYLDSAGVVADIRGAWPEELIFARGFDGFDEADKSSRADYEAALSTLRFVLTRSASVLSVSPEMLMWLKRVGATEDKLTFVPCCVSRIQFSSAARDEVRRALSLDDKLVFVYLGSIARYQHIPDGLIPFFKVLAAECADAHLLCLTRETESMRSALASGGVALDRATVLNLPHDRVAEHLCAADAGLLLRAPSNMNRYSRPTKLGEYLASGLPIILSRGMGETDALVEKSGAGLVVDVFGRDEAGLRQEAERVIMRLRVDGERMRASALRIADEQFLWGRYVSRVRDAYLKAIES